MHRFYLPKLIVGETAALPEDEAHHLARVLRLHAGDRIIVFDGRGAEALAEVASIAGGSAHVRVVEARSAIREPVVRITLVQALIKSDKMDRVIRDAVMLGVAAIQPVTTRRSDVPKAALQSGVRLARWDRTVLASVKQCGRAVVPPVHQPIAFEEWVAGKTAAAGAVRLMFVEPGSAPATDADFAEERPSDVHVVIGPEGGWAAEEVEQARAAGVRLVTLGGATLRADAAAAAALAILRYAWRDL